MVLLLQQTDAAQTLSLHHSPTGGGVTRIECLYFNIYVRIDSNQVPFLDVSGLHISHTSDSFVINLNDRLNIVRMY